MLVLMCLDWIEAAEVLKKHWHDSAQVDDEQSTDEGTMCIAWKTCMELKHNWYSYHFAHFLICNSSSSSLLGSTGLLGPTSS